MGLFPLNAGVHDTVIVRDVNEVTSTLTGGSGRSIVKIKKH